MRGQMIACLVSMTGAAGLGYLYGAGKSDPPAAAYARLPAYGAQAAPQPPPPSPLEQRLQAIEADLKAANEKLDRLLKLVEDDAAGGPQNGEPPAALISAATRCEKCHAPDTADKGGGFVLFAFTDKEKTGLAFAALNSFQKQKAVKRLTTQDAGFKMPPPPSGPPLTEAERAALLAVFQDLPKKGDK
jgi:hypothetical protein